MQHLCQLPKHGIHLFVHENSSLGGGSTLGKTNNNSNSAKNAKNAGATTMTQPQASASAGSILTTSTTAMERNNLSSYAIVRSRSDSPRNR